MSYIDDRSVISNNKKTKGSMNKSNVTLWKSKYHQSGPVQFEEEKKAEEDYIENLKKQVYFMEMELKLLKEREKEIEKSGGFTQLFNDDRDAGQHIQLLKNKYANMRKIMETKHEDLSNKKREVFGDNVSLKAKLESLKQLEKEIYEKLINLEEKSQQKLHYLENELLTKNRDRLDLEASNRVVEVDIKNELKINQELEFYLVNNEKMENLTQSEFESEMETIETITNEKTKQYEEINFKIKDIDKKLNEDPFYKVELEKNETFKSKIKDVERDTLEVNSTIQCLELANEFLLSKKEEIVSERKKLINQNDELKHEIEAKNQLNEIRIQKKMKENNSEELQKLDAHLKSVNESILDLEGKIGKEQEKSRMFISEILKLNIELRHKKEKIRNTNTSTDEKKIELDELKSKFEDLKNEHLNLKEKINKETTDNVLLKNRYKALLEEFSTVDSKFNFISQNYDYTSNLKKLSLDDMRNLTQTNNLVNDSIMNFLGKVGNFKKENIQNLIDIDKEML